MTAIGFFALSPTKAGTKVTMGMEYEMPYSILGKLIDKLRVHKAMEKDLEKGLNGIKIAAEQ